MDNKLIMGLALGGMLLVGFAAGRFTASSDTIVKEPGEKSSGKTKVATKRTSTYRVPHAESAANVAAPEAPAENPNPSGRGRGKFDPAAYAAMMKERAVTERSNLFASASLTPAQQQDFDDLVSAMNSSLKQRSEKLLAMMKKGKPVDPEMGYHFLHEYSSTMMRSYEMMDRTMPAGWREKAGANFNLRNFMDPALREATRGYRSPGGGNPGGGAGGPPPQ